MGGWTDGWMDGIGQNRMGWEPCSEFGHPRTALLIVICGLFIDRYFVLISRIPNP